MLKESPLKFQFTVLAENVGLRLDRILSMQESITSRSRAQQLIELKLVKVNGKIAKGSYAVEADDVVDFELPVESSELLPLDRDLDILHEDDDVAVIFKPSGLVVHPAEGHAQDTLVNILVAKIKNLSMGFHEKRPGIVHRLDKETSGLLVIAKNDKAHHSLAEQFKARSVQRQYFALVYGSPDLREGRIETQIGRHPIHRKRFANVTQGGKTSITNYKVHKESAKGITELRVRLETGRTHQIRVHLSELGHPIVGDSLYGSDTKLKNIKSKSLKDGIASMGRIALHAAVLGFRHPSSGKNLYYELDWPEDMRNILEILNE